MIVKKIMLLASTVALMSTPGWAMAAAPSNHGRPADPSHPGHSHRCQPHRVAYVASGSLVSQALTRNTDGSYSGELVVEVKSVNHHARPAKGTTQTYKVEHVKVTFGLADVNSDGSVGLDDLTAGDRVRLIGKITTLANKCDQTGFTATTMIKHLIFHASAKS